jgi:hypothetical protein
MPCALNCTKKVCMLDWMAEMASMNNASPKRSIEKLTSHIQYERAKSRPSQHSWPAIELFCWPGPFLALDGLGTENRPVQCLPDPRIFWLSTFAPEPAWGLLCPFYLSRSTFSQLNFRPLFPTIFHHAQFHTSLLTWDFCVDKEKGGKGGRGGSFLREQVRPTIVEIFACANF